MPERTPEQSGEVRLLDLGRLRQMESLLRESTSPALSRVSTEFDPTSVEKYKPFPGGMGSSQAPFIGVVARGIIKGIIRKAFGVERPGGSCQWTVVKIEGCCPSVQTL